MSVTVPLKPVPNSVPNFPTPRVKSLSASMADMSGPVMLANRTSRSLWANPSPQIAQDATLGWSKVTMTGPSDSYMKF